MEGIHCQDAVLYTRVRPSGVCGVVYLFVYSYRTKHTIMRTLRVDILLHRFTFYTDIIDRERVHYNTHVPRNVYYFAQWTVCMRVWEWANSLLYIYSYAAILSLRIGEWVRRWWQRRLFETKAKRKAKRYKHSSNNIKIGLKGVSTSVYMAYICHVRACVLSGTVLEAVWSSFSASWTPHINVSDIPHNSSSFLHPIPWACFYNFMNPQHMYIYLWM